MRQVLQRLAVISVPLLAVLLLPSALAFASDDGVCPTCGRGGPGGGGGGMSFTLPFGGSFGGFGGEGPGGPDKVHGQGIVYGFMMIQDGSGQPQVQSFGPHTFGVPSGGTGAPAPQGGHGWGGHGFGDMHEMMKKLYEQMQQWSPSHRGPGAWRAHQGPGRGWPRRGGQHPQRRVWSWSSGPQVRTYGPYMRSFLIRGPSAQGRHQSFGLPNWPQPQPGVAPQNQQQQIEQILQQVREQLENMFQGQGGGPRMFFGPGGGGGPPMFFGHPGHGQTEPPATTEPATPMATVATVAPVVPVAPPTAQGEPPPPPQFPTFVFPQGAGPWFSAQGTLMIQRDGEPPQTVQFDAGNLEELQEQMQEHLQEWMKTSGANGFQLQGFPQPPTPAVRPIETENNSGEKKDTLQRADQIL